MTAQEPFDLTPYHRMMQRYVMWGIALAGSFSAATAVTLRPNPAWSQEESAQQNVAGNQNADQAVTPQQVRQWIQTQQFDKAIAAVDQALAQDPDNAEWLSTSFMLNNYLARVKPDVGVSRLRAAIEGLLAKDRLNPPQISALFNSTWAFASYAASVSDDEKLNLVDRVLARLEESRLNQALAGNMMELKIRLLTRAGRAAEAKELLEQLIAEQEQSTGNEEQAASRLVTLATTFWNTLGNQFPDEAQAALNAAEQRVRNLLSQEKTSSIAIGLLFNLKIPVIARSLYSDPKQAKQVLDELDSEIASLRDKLDEQGTSLLKQFEKRLDSYRSRLESALKREALIGTAAPEIDADAFVGMEPVTMDDLKGKVVLLDFWAVWCGPCIATFPHLIQWHEKYADKGLVILGATRYYGYVWDEAAGRATRGEGEVDRETELAMLERFRQEHGLRHGFFVTPKDSNYAQQFYVTGIPQAVLIDKEGIIRMIKVGAGEENAHALEEKIQELLGG